MTRIDTGFPSRSREGLGEGVSERSRRPSPDPSRKREGRGI
jgi:hypothetical protein